MKYQVIFSSSAARDFRKLPASEQLKISVKINALAANPRPHGVLKLAAEHSLYRIRVGDYRIIYRIEDQILQVLIVRVGDRKNVYRPLKPN